MRVDMPVMLVGAEHWQDGAAMMPCAWAGVPRNANTVAASAAPNASSPAMRSGTDFMIVDMDSFAVDKSFDRSACERHTLPRQRASTTAANHRPMRKCRMPSPPDQTNAAATATTRVDLSGERHITGLHRALIGPVSADYYLPVLARLDTRERAIPIWNWAACLCTLNWMVFRGLWGPAMLYAGALLGAALGVLGLTMLGAPMADSLQWSLWAAWSTLALLVPGFFGNAWLYTVYRKRLDDALSATASLQDACLRLSRQASRRPRLVWIALANLVLAGLLLASWQAVPWRHPAPPVDGARQPVTQPSSTAAADRVDAGPVAPIAIAAEPTRPVSASPGSAGATPPGSTIAAAPWVAERRRSTRFGGAARTPVSNPATALSGAVPANPSTAPLEPFLINVGLFAQSDNAQRAHTRLRDAGLPAYTQELERAGGKLTRVRVGPFATRTQADEAAQKIRALQLDAVVARP